MIYKGYKIRISCADWEQVELLGRYWNLFKTYAESEKLVGLGMNWANDCFDYAIGVIDDEEILARLRTIDFSKTNFSPEYIEITLPELSEWQTFRGKEDSIRQVYEQEVDSVNRPYDYELESIDSKGNLEIKIHFCN